MIAVLTGDIINSGKVPSEDWLPQLKAMFGSWGESPADWVVYRGDEFQLRVAPEIALRCAVHLKARIRSIRGLDVRLAIGIGEETHSAARVSESNGSAYLRSGRCYERLRSEKVNLALSSGNNEFDRTFNLMLRLALDFMDEWTAVSAQIVDLGLSHPAETQSSLANRLKIKQSAVSQRQKRARKDLLDQLLDYYTDSLKSIKA